MKSIHLNSATVDNSGSYVDAGGKLDVGKDAKPGVITAERARDLVDRGAASVIEDKTSK